MLTSMLLPEPDRDAARRTAAAWLAGTGAFLLVAAAAVFTAVNWSALTPEAKLGVLVGLTGACLAGGAALRQRLPATGTVVLHLGALLIPVDLGALQLRLALPAPWLLVLVGGVTAAVHAGLAVAVRSGWLRWTATIAVATAATGVAAAGGPPAPAVIATLAAAAATWRATSANAAALGTIAALTPAVVLASAPLAGTPPVLVDAGWLGDGHLLWAVATTVGAAIGLARHADRARARSVAVGAVLVPLVPLVVAWSGLEGGSAVRVLSVPALVLCLEVLAWRTGSLAFWRGPLHAVGAVAEAVATVVVPFAGFVVLLAPALDVDLFGAGPIDPEPLLGGAFGLLALAWAVADLRWRDHRGGPVVRALTPWVAAVHVVAAVASLTASPAVVALTLVAVAAAAAAVQRPATGALAATAAVWAVVTADTLATQVPVLLASLTLLVRRARRAPSVWAARAFAAASVTALAVAAATLVAPPVPRPLVYAIGALVLAAATEDRDRPTADVLRLTGVAGSLTAAAAPAGDALLVGAAVAAAFVVDAVVRRRPELAHGAIVPLLVALVALGSLLGLETHQTGLLLTAVAAVLGGVATSTDTAWSRPVTLGALASLVLGAGLAATDPGTLTTVLVVDGGLLVAAGLATQRPAVAHLGGVVATVGLWRYLDRAHVAALEAYVAPVSAQLLVAGAALRRGAHRRPVSSWAAYAAPIGLLGLAAVVERAAGGGGAHALVAGGVATAAVLVGAWRRLAAPLVLGTVLLVAVAVHESLAVAASVPTWGWLGAGGTLLLSAGVALERSDRSPVDAGRAVAQVLARRFD